MITISCYPNWEVIAKMPVGVNQSEIKSAISTFPNNKEGSALDFIKEMINKGYSVLVTRNFD